METCKVDSIYWTSNSAQASKLRTSIQISMFSRIAPLLPKLISDEALYLWGMYFANAAEDKSDDTPEGKPIWNLKFEDMVNVICRLSLTRVFSDALRLKMVPNVWIVADWALCWTTGSKRRMACCLQYHNLRLWGRDDSQVLVLKRCSDRCCTIKWSLGLMMLDHLVVVMKPSLETWRCMASPLQTDGIWINAVEMLVLTLVLNQGVSALVLLAKTWVHVVHSQQEHITCVMECEFMSEACKFDGLWFCYCRSPQILGRGNRMRNTRNSARFHLTQVFKL